ncbi:MAG TPA: hypothetical protein VD997_16535 [Phycisphaerales bacterium]|nr:hypothetical protein [Phycisphaerales bacterium]
MLDKLLTGDAIWFGVPALVGTLLFVIRMVLMLFAGHGMDVDHGGGGDVTDGGGAVDGHDAAGAFKALSLQTLLAFAMGFGWGGILGLYTLKWDLGRSLLVGMGMGLFMVWLLAVMLKATMELQSSGNVRLENAVGSEADVYVQIPERGQGQVKLVVKDRMRIVNASWEGEGVPQASRVRVVRVNPDNSVTVTPLG